MGLDESDQQVVFEHNNAQRNGLGRLVPTWVNIGARWVKITRADIQQTSITHLIEARFDPAIDFLQHQMRISWGKNAHGQPRYLSVKGCRRDPGRPGIMLINAAEVA